MACTVCGCFEPHDMTLPDMVYEAAFGVVLCAYPTAHIGFYDTRFWQRTEVFRDIDAALLADEKWLAVLHILSHCTTGTIPLRSKETGEALLEIREHVHPIMLENNEQALFLSWYPQPRVIPVA